MNKTFCSPNTNTNKSNSRSPVFRTSNKTFSFQVEQNSEHNKSSEQNIEHNAKPGRTSHDISTHSSKYQWRVGKPSNKTGESEHNVQQNVRMRTDHRTKRVTANRTPNKISRSEHNVQQNMLLEQIIEQNKLTANRTPNKSNIGSEQNIEHRLRNSRKLRGSPGKSAESKSVLGKFRDFLRLSAKFREKQKISGRSWQHVNDFQRTPGSLGVPRNSRK